MDSRSLYLLAADVILFTHVLFVAFVIFGLLLIIAGKLLSWFWIWNPWFRLVHLIASSVVVLQSWLGVICPLTSWEMVLRERAGDSVYSGTFISHWLKTILYYHASEWVFIICYTVFGSLVLASWFWVRPRPFTTTKDHGST